MSHSTRLRQVGGQGFLFCVLCLSRFLVLGEWWEVGPPYDLYFGPKYSNEDSKIYITAQEGLRPGPPGVNN